MPADQDRPSRAPAPARPPHPATVAQPKATIGTPAARPPHPATVVQKKPAIAAPTARPPHPATVVQKKPAASGRGSALQAMRVAEIDLVLSGHGGFSVGLLETEGRKKLPKLTVPHGVRVTFYAPDGAALDNPVANSIERGSYPSNAELELKMIDAARTQPLPDDYPKTFEPGDDLINYTLGPPLTLNVISGDHVFTTESSETLSTLVDAALLVGLKNRSVVHIHWAACGSFRADRFEELFPYRGWYCRLK